MKRIGIIAKNNRPAHDAARKLARWLAARGRTVVIDERTAQALGVPGRRDADLPGLADMIIVLGGDGTLLSAARIVSASRRKVPLFGVNLGSLGFMAEVSLDELYASLGKAIEGRFQAEERMMLTARVVRRGKTIEEYTVLNDAVLNKGVLARMVSLSVSVGDDHLTSIRADGLIIATPTGSTAYSLSAGGPIVHPTIHSIVVTPICPHTLTNRPIVIPDTSVVRVRVVTGGDGVSLTLDGQVVAPLQPDDIVEVTKAKYRVRMIKHPAKNYYEILRTKLKWGR